MDRNHEVYESIIDELSDPAFEQAVEIALQLDEFITEVCNNFQGTYSSWDYLDIQLSKNFSWPVKLRVFHDGKKITLPVKPYRRMLRIPAASKQECNFVTYLLRKNGYEVTCTPNALVIRATEKALMSTFISRITTIQLERDTYRNHIALVVCEEVMQTKRDSWLFEHP